MNDIAAFDLEAVRRDTAEGLALLFAASCPKCRWMARAVIWLSGHSIRGIPLDRPQWRHLYDRILPESRGSPILIHNGRLIWGWRLFAMTPFLAWRSAIRKRLWKG